MKIVALHTDFRIYWPARLRALDKALKQRCNTLEVIEIAGKGSPYSFADKNEVQDINWHILFPDAKPEDLNGAQIEPVLFNLLDKISPDVILAGAIAFPSGALAVRYGQLHKTKVVIFDDSKILAVKRNPIVNFIKQAVYNGVDAVFYPAEDWIETGEFWKFNRNQMFFGVDVVDNDFWSQLRDIENPYGDYFVAVGRQIPKKNFDKIIEAYAQYASKIGYENAYKLLLIGEGPEHENLMEEIKHYEINNNVVVLPYQSQGNLVVIYQNAKGIIVNSNIEETWGLVINEAMAAGCVVFASNQCGATNILVKNGINGFRFDFNDVDKLADSLMRFHNLSSEKQNEMRQASKNIISEWGLKKFTDGAVGAIDYTMSHRKRRTSFIDKLIISKWKGQYRPI